MELGHDHTIARGPCNGSPTHVGVGWGFCDLRQTCDRASRFLGPALGTATGHSSSRTPSHPHNVSVGSYGLNLVLVSAVCIASSCTASKNYAQRGFKTPGAFAPCLLTMRLARAEQVVMTPQPLVRPEVTTCLIPTPTLPTSSAVAPAKRAKRSRP